MGAGAGKKSEIDRDAVKTILGHLKKDLERITTDPGGPARVKSEGRVTSSDLGGAQGLMTGTQLATNTESAYNVIDGEYGRFVEGYKQLIERLEAAVSGHDQKEDTNVDSINRVNAASASAPTNRNAQPW